MTQNSEHSSFKMNLTTRIMGVGAFLSLFFAALHALGMNDIGDFHALVNVAFGSTSLALILLLRYKPQSYIPILTVFLLAAFATCTSALIHVSIDAFRAIWFYLVVQVAFMLGQPRLGWTFTVLSVGAIVAIESVQGLGLSRETLTSSIVGLIFMSMIAYIFTNQVARYAHDLGVKNATLQKLASEDCLTGIYNTRSYYEIGCSLFELCKRQDRDLSVLFMDLDFFKKVNDTHGHSVGDQLLVSLSKVIKSHLRKSDVFARIGGEEFAVLLPDTDLNGATVLGDKIRLAVADSVTLVSGFEIRSTLSVGVASLEASDERVQDIQERADKALYMAKDDGRNRVTPFFTDAA